MTNSDHKQSRSLISNVFGVAKKLSATGLSVMNHVAPGTVSKLTQAPEASQVIQGSARTKGVFEKKQYDNPQQMMREHLPKVSSQLLGRHYKKMNQVVSFISPDLNDKLSDYVFDKLNDAVSQLTSVEGLLKEVGAKSLEELTKDPERAARISQALANQNKIIAALQGAVTGSTGVIGAALDVPTSLALALRSIYHTGRAYGFELKVEDQNIVEYIFKQLDLGTVAEKQALLATFRTLSQVAQTHNMSQLQQLLGSSNDTEMLKKMLTNDDGSFKWAWMNNIPQMGFISRLTPLASIGISAIYSWKLVDDATDHAKVVFHGARQYILQHPENDLDALTAYERFLAQAPVLLLDAFNTLAEDAVDAAPENDAIQPISDVQVAPKTKGEAVPLVDVLNENEATPKKVTEKVQQDEELIVEPDVKVPLENSTIDTIAQNNTEPSLDSADMKSKPLATEQVQIEGENTKKPTEKKRTIRKTAVKNEEPLSSKEDTSQPND